MRTYWIVFLGMTLSHFGFAQDFFDSFESYQVGEYLTSESDFWITLDKSKDGPDDALVVSDRSSEGNNSIFIESHDDYSSRVFLPFETIYIDGTLEFEMSVFIPENTGMFFALQKDNATGAAGQEALSFYFLEDGLLFIREARIRTSYPTDEWFNLKCKANLGLNQYEVFIDNKSVGEFAIFEEGIGGVQFFAINATTCGSGKSGCWVDAVSYGHLHQPLPIFNAAIYDISEVRTYPGGKEKVQVRVRNLGYEPISSFTLNLEHDGQIVSQHFEIEPLEEREVVRVVFAESIVVQRDSLPITVSLYQINQQSGTDHRPSDNTRTEFVKVIEPDPNRMVIVETRTSTSCDNCPSIQVEVDELEDIFPENVRGIEVHFEDPMALPNYADHGPFENRNNHVFVFERTGRHHKQIETGEAQFLYTLLENKAPVAITNGAVIDKDRGVLHVSSTYHLLLDGKGQYSGAIVLVEDGVTGSAEMGYSQSNGYVDGKNGSMGGFERLPDPVPASQMTYNRVARTILPDVNGTSEGLPVNPVRGETYTQNFQIPISPDWNVENLRIISMFIGPCGLIKNGADISLFEALNNECVDCPSIKPLFSGQELTLFPNPTNNDAIVVFDEEASQKVLLTVSDLSGKELLSIDFGPLNAPAQLPITISNWPPAVYLVELQTDSGSRFTKMLVY